LAELERRVVEAETRAEDSDDKVSRAFLKPNPGTHKKEFVTTNDMPASYFVKS